MKSLVHYPASVGILLESIMISRRNFLAVGMLAAASAVTRPTLLRADPPRRFHALPALLAKLEKDCGGRLGVAVVDTGSEERAGFRADERFAMCSTFKMLLAAAVLERADGGRENLGRSVAIPATGLLANSPLTQEHAGGTMTIAELCGAIVTRSDNTAANLLLATIDGPAGITRFAHSLGDPVTRLDRVETALNEALPAILEIRLRRQRWWRTFESLCWETHCRPLRGSS
jgi:beta-lactamase class A